MPNVFADPADVTPELAAARKAKYGGQGTGSFVVDTLSGLSGRKNKQRFLDTTYENLTRPLMNADERAGAALSKKAPSWMQGLMTRKELLPVPGAGPGGGPMHVQRSVKAVSEPLMKVKGVAVPVAAAMLLGSMLHRNKAQAPEQTDEELLRQLGYYYDDPAFRKTGAAMSEQQLMKEAAAKIEELAVQNKDAIEKLSAAQLEKQAGDVVWEMVERGVIPPITSREEFAEKLAMVQSRGADLTRAAIEFAPTLPDFMIDKAASAPGGASGDDPLTRFVFTGEL